jgi:hypothetical protein
LGYIRTRVLHRVLFSSPLISCILASHKLEYYLGNSTLSFINFYSFNCWQESSCHCMSRPYPSPVVIPPPIGLQEQLRQNRTAYFNYRSFQQNWTVNSIIHVPLYRPGGSSIIAGEHYFEWRPAGSTLPVVSVCFVIAPIHLKFPSSRFDGTSILICSHWVPKELPHFVYKEIEHIEDLNP